MQRIPFQNFPLGRALAVFRGASSRGGQPPRPLISPSAPAGSASPPPVFIPTVTTTGKDTFKLEVGKPVFSLTPKQFGAQFGVVRETVYLWIQDGTIPPGMWERGGKLKLRISSAAVALLKSKFAESYAP